jgi:dienelactone hydrolase
MAADKKTEMTTLGPEALQAVKAFYDYDPRIPLDARIVERLEEGETRRDKIVFRGVRSFWVPGLLETPPGDGPHPCVLLLHGWSWSKECWYDDDNYVSGGNLRRALLEAGFAIFALDAQIHGDRIAENDYAVTNIWPGEGEETQMNFFTLPEICEQTVRDYRRGLDYLQTRPEIDMERIGAIGYSMGAWQIFPLSACEPRVKVSVATALPTEIDLYDPVSPWNYAAGITQPFLIQLGRQDESSPKESGEQLCALISSSVKQLLWYDGDHSLPVAYVPDAVTWFRTHLKE